MEEVVDKKEEKRKGFWYWLKRNFYPILLIFSALIIILTITLIMLSKAQWFRFWVSGFIFTTVNNELQEGARFEFKDIRFSYLLGIKLNDVSLTYQGDTVLFVKELDAGLKLAPLFRNKIIVNEIVLDSPQINFYRSTSDSLWIIEKILKPSLDTTVSEPADWLIQVKKIRIRNGDLRFFDSTIAYNKSKKLDFDHFRLKSFYLKMNVEIDLKKSKYKSDIRELSFYDSYSGNKIKELELIAMLDTSGVIINDMFFRTSNSSFELNTELSKFNVFDDADIGKARFKVNMTSHNLDIDEIGRLIPEDIPISGNCSFNMLATGKLNHFFTQFQDLSFGKSNLNFSANIINVINDNRVVEFDFDDSRLLKNNMDDVIRKLEITGIPDFGDMSIKELKGKFKMDSLFAVFDLNSSLGNAKGEAGVGIKDTISYSGKVHAENLDLSRILLDETLSSNINADVDFSGSGDSPEILKLSVNMNMINSKIMDYSFNNFLLRAKTQERGKIYIDTLLIGFGNSFTEPVDSTIRQKSTEKISLSGFADFSDMSNPKYDLITSVRNINLMKIFNNPDIPEHLDANMVLKGEGFEPDSMNTIINLDISKWILRGKKLTPLKIDVAINKDENQFKTFNIKSKILTFNISGNFNYLDLMDKILLDFVHLKNFVDKKIENIFPTENDNILLSQTNNIYKTGEYNFDLSLRFIDSELIKSFLQLNKFDSDINLKLKYKATDSISLINISEFQVTNFVYDDGDNNLKIFPTTGDGNIQLNYQYQQQNEQQSIAEIHPNLEFNLISKEGVNLNDLTISNINSQFGFENNRLNLGVIGELNDMYKLKAKSSLYLDSDHIDILFDKFDFKYSDKIEFSSKEPFNLVYKNKELTINKFKLLSDKLDLIELSGSVGENYFKNLNLKVYNYNIEHVWEFIPRDEIEIGYELKGNLDSLEIGLNGTFEKTDINLNLDLGKLSVGESYFGNITADLMHRNSVLSGNILFYNPYSKLNKNLLKLTLGKIPVNLSIEAEGDRFYENNPIALSLETSQFPLKILSPFISEVKNLSGFADINLNITGNGLENIKYGGLLSYKNTQFLLETNNMNFSSDGVIKLTTDTITVEKISLKNNPTDIANGEAIAKGKIILDKLEPKAFDLRVFSNRFKVLSQASMKSMPSLYGDFVVSFGPKPMRFFGTMEAPYLSGDVNILRAALIMPNTSSTEVKKSVLKYEIKSDSTIEFTIVDDSISSVNRRQNVVDRKQEATKGKEKSFGDLLDINVGIKFKGRFVMTMDITGMGQLFAEIGTQNPDDELRYVMKRGADEPQIYGTEIYVKEGSSLKLIKMLDTKGIVSFQKGVIDNPGLDLIATYKGQRYLTDKLEPYEVYMYIKGTKEKPSISFGYSIYNDIKTGDSSKINEDALLLLTLGKTKEELQNAGGSGGVDYMASASSIASSMASSALTDFVQASSFIQSADIDIGSSLQNLDQARMKFSGDIKGIKWTLGGTVSDFTNNNQISIDFPISSLSNIKWLNMVLQLTKVTSSAQTTTTKNQKDWEIKLRVGGSW
ncbi:MAG: hypothetical protein V1779_02800 [bacterium]